LVFRFRFNTLISFSLLFSVVEQEKGQKGDQNSEHWAEDSEPKCRVPAGLGDGIGFCLSHFLFPLVARDWLQTQGLQRGRGECPRYAQVVFFLITRESGLGFVSSNSVDRAAIVTKLRKL
jgi:hypothetical protein